MARVYISVGSNIDRTQNVLSCLEELQSRYRRITVSTIYESKPVGFDGDNFYNLAVGFDTDKDVHTVAQELRDIEHQHGRTRGDVRFSSRTLDLDLLLYDDLVLEGNGLKLPRGEITRYAFVLKPLAEIAGDFKHPVEGRNIRQIWQAFKDDRQQLWPVDLPSKPK
jgi:2-amino-4-hydroxy-6-hydroxymethyldihydropteridine diphosphokinase